MKGELKLFFTALLFYTRIPVPRRVYHDQKKDLSKSLRYLSLIGILVGAIGGAIFFAAHLILTKDLAVVFSMASTILLTGAFHEDGLADAADGFGGGTSKENVLSIMKDSRIGTYGVISLVIILAIKFLALHEIKTNIIPVVLISGHALSRAMASFLVLTQQYVSDYETSKAGDAVESTDNITLFLSLFFGIMPVILINKDYILLSLILPGLTGLLLGAYFKKRIGGFTGDCAGAVQQITEIMFYISLLILWRFT
jgi:adenosylcobinamide-GDP ribazoletransferase